MGIFRRNKLHPFGNAGFTTVELIIIVGIIATLVSFATVNLLKTRSTTSLTSTLNTLLADLRNQQIKSMAGDSEGRIVNSSYGIYFEANRYILFHDTYSSTDPSNYVVALEPNFQFQNILFPQNQIVFAINSGEIVNFISGSNSLKLTDTSNGQSKTIQLNKYGAIIMAN